MKKYLFSLLLIFPFVSFGADEITTPEHVTISMHSGRNRENNRTSLTSQLERWKEKSKEFFDSKEALCEAREEHARLKMDNLEEGYRNSILGEACKNLEQINGQKNKKIVEEQREREIENIMQEEELARCNLRLIEQNEALSIRGQYFSVVQKENYRLNEELTKMEGTISLADDINLTPSMTSVGTQINLRRTKSEDKKGQKEKEKHSWWQINKRFYSVLAAGILIGGGITGAGMHLWNRCK